MVNELIEKGELSREEAGQVMDELIKRGEEEKTAIHKMVQEEMGKIKKDLSMSTKSELEQLKQRIEELERRINQ